MLANEQAKRIKLGVVDIDGVLRGKYVSSKKFDSASRDGLGFCDVIFGWDSADMLYDNVKHTGWHTGYPDIQAKPDLSSKRDIPWEPGTEFYLLDLYTPDGKLLPIAPRNVLKGLVDEAHRLEFEPFFGVEFEFCFFAETPHSLREKGFRGLNSLSPGMFGYSALRTSQSAALMSDILGQMAAFDIELEGLHTETGPGIFEAAIAVDKTLRAADKAALFKTALKEIASRHGLIVTFMAKWNMQLPGSSGHLHQSLWDLAGEINLFTKHAVVNSYMAGILEHMHELTAIYCPTINSYKRLVPGTWAPVNSSWGRDNRTTAIRDLSSNKKTSRIELRLTGADINPYLAISASLASGLDGVKRKLELPSPVNNAYSELPRSLPTNLGDATATLRASKFAAKALGAEFVDHYALTREWEWREFEKAVTTWELERYFEII